MPEAFKAEYESSPFWQYMGIKFDSLEGDQIRIKMPLTSNYSNVNGTTHGGIMASLLDSIMGVTARHHNFPAAVATISLTTQYIAPGIEGTTIYATARVVHSGRKIVTMEAKLESDSGKLIATGVGTFMIKS